jgi:hypothetical protein
MTVLRSARWHQAGYDFSFIEPDMDVVGTFVERLSGRQRYRLSSLATVNMPLLFINSTPYQSLGSNGHTLSSGGRFGSGGLLGRHDGLGPEPSEGGEAQPREQRQHQELGQHERRLCLPGRSHDQGGNPTEQLN